MSGLWAVTQLTRRMLGFILQTGGGVEVGLDIRILGSKFKHMGLDFKDWRLRI